MLHQLKNQRRGRLPHDELDHDVEYEKIGLDFFLNLL